MRIISLAACLCAVFILQSLALAQTPTAIRIGILNDQSGPYSTFADVRFCIVLLLARRFTSFGQPFGHGYPGGD